VSARAGHVFHLYAVRVQGRDAVLEGLKAEGVMAGVHYPVTLNKQPALREYAQPFETPVADEAADKLISLPIFPGIAREQVKRVSEVLCRTLDAGGGA